MAKGLRAAIMAALCLVWFMGCEAVSDLQSSAFFEDGKIMATVKANLAREDRDTVQGIDVSVNGGAVKLKGSAPSADKKNKYGEIAGKVSGVKSVENNIEIKP